MDDFSLLPRLLGSRLHLAWDETPKWAQDHWGGLVDVYGQSLVAQLTVPARQRVGEAMRLPGVDAFIHLVSLVVRCDQTMTIQTNMGGTIQSRFWLLAGTHEIEFREHGEHMLAPFCYVSWDVESLGDAPLRLEVQLICHVMARHYDMPNLCLEVGHIETEAEYVARVERERRAAEIFSFAQEKAWAELSQMIGVDAATGLQQGRAYDFQGSNGQTYRVMANGDLANLTRQRRYCVVLRASEQLCLPDVIMSKVQWCQHDADEVERVKNDVGGLLTTEA